MAKLDAISFVLGVLLGIALIAFVASAEAMDDFLESTMWGFICVILGGGIIWYGRSS